MKKVGGNIIALLAVVAGGAFAVADEPEPSIAATTRQRYHVSHDAHQTELQKGFSGTDSLPEGQAMVFAFASDSKWGYVDERKNYPIDMVWLQ